jgi:hypothetical protein
MFFCICAYSTANRIYFNIFISSLIKEKVVYANEGEERRANALAVLKLVCESPVFGPHLEALLATQGNQPIMLIK